jgi:hypothetical protein
MTIKHHCQKLKTTSGNNKELHRLTLRAADEMLTEAATALQRYEKKSTGAKKGLWPWQNSRGK